MYRIIPKKGDVFGCNESHVLTLRFGGRRKPPAWLGVKLDRTVNMTVQDYLNQPHWLKAYLSLYRTGINFKAKQVKINPYLLGLWLGDGNSDKTQITTFDEIIAARIFAEGAVRGLRVTRHGYKKEKY